MDEPFNPEYYAHVLLSLTVNSRALITELTSLAERYVDQAPEIVDLIEERTRKCLPQYKLFAIYLIDSICKNIGNPYNLVFGTKLYSIFTLTYLVVTDTPTRQNLINLFKTWTLAQTSLGLPLFPEDVIKKIEEFIIKATSISGSQAPPPQHQRITLDMLLREANYLLQYMIALDDELETMEVDESTLKQMRLLRNNLVFSINTISDGVMTANKEEFEKRAPAWQADLQAIRKEIDSQCFQQRDLIKQKPKDLASASIVLSEPNGALIESIFTESEEDITHILASWGLQKPEAKPVPETRVEVAPTVSPVKQAAAETSGLGLNWTSIEFSDLFLGSPKNAVTHVVNEDDDDDSYDPEDGLVKEVHPPQPAPQPEAPALVLKRPADTDKRVAKKVRFAED